jgi:hypothetical protein
MDNKEQEQQEQQEQQETKQKRDKEIISSLNPIDNMTLELLINKRQMKKLFQSNTLTTSKSKISELCIYKPRILGIYQNYLNNIETETDNSEIQTIMENLTQKIINHLKRMDEIEGNEEDDNNVLFSNMDMDEESTTIPIHNSISFWGKRFSKQQQK